MSTTTPRVYWVSPAPTGCDICNAVITGSDPFIDGRTRFGPWACMCSHCHAVHGYGLGTGKGQKYERQADGRWLKVAG